MNGPAHNRRIENGDRGEDDQPFVSSRIGAMLPGEKNQRDEGQDVESGNGKERKDIGPPGVRTISSIAARIARAGMEQARAKPKRPRRR